MGGETLPLTTTKFNKEKFLYKLLASIFVFELIFLGLAWGHCLGRNNDCPDLGDRSEQIFNVAIATTLSLLAGQRILK